MANRFIVFFKESQHRLHKAYPCASQQQLAKIAGQEWRSMSEQSKESYNRRARSRSRRSSRRSSRGSSRRRSRG